MLTLTQWLLLMPCQDEWMNWSYADYLAWEARSKRRVQEPITPAPVASESDLHDKISDYCRAQGWIALHGSTAHKTFRTLGEPDYTLLLPKGRMLLVECKRRDGKLSPAQNAMAAHAARLGHTIHVIRSFEDFVALVK